MNNPFLHNWSEAALTSLGFFWMALWAFVLGYMISSCIQVFVTRERMQRSMGGAGPRSVALATFFGFISSSCSFAALATTKSLFKKGAGIVPALAFLLASTNLVIELGIVIAIFLAWQFVAAEYIGGILLILCMWALVRLTLPASWEEAAREQAGAAGEGAEPANWRELMFSREGWQRVARRYFMEWRMVWRDVVFGFTIAGVISAFVPPAFFTTLFLGSGSEADPSFWQVCQQTLVGPLAAFFTFIGSMGNIPLAALLYSHGVSFAGVMAFIFSDLVVFPVLRINAQYYGWRMALYLVGVLLVSLFVTSLAMHYGFLSLGMLPDAAGAKQVLPSDRFAVDHTLFLNLAFLGMTGGLAWLWFSAPNDEEGHNHEHGESGWGDYLLTAVACGSLVWLLVGLGLAAAGI